MILNLWSEDHERPVKIYSARSAVVFLKYSSTLHAFSINSLCLVSTFSLRGIISNGILWSGGSINWSPDHFEGIEFHATPVGRKEIHNRRHPWSQINVYDSRGPQFLDHGGISDTFPSSSDGTTAWIGGLLKIIYAKVYNLRRSLWIDAEAAEMRDDKWWSARMES